MPFELIRPHLIECFFQVAYSKHIRYLETMKTDLISISHVPVVFFRKLLIHSTCEKFRKQT